MSSAAASLRAAAPRAQIGFEIEDRRIAYLLFVERIFRQAMGRTRESIHGSLRVRRDDDQTAAGWDRIGKRRRREFHALSPDVVGEDLTQLIVANLADESGTSAERRDPGDRIGRDPPLVSAAGPMSA